MSDGALWAIVIQLVCINIQLALLVSAIKSRRGA